MEVSMKEKRREREDRLGAPARARRASGEASGGSGDGRGRFSSRRKTDAIMRVLRGENLASGDAVSDGLVDASFAPSRP